MRRHHVPGEEHAVAAINRRSIPPGRSGHVDRARPRRHHLPSPPRLPLAPAGIRGIEQPLEPSRRAVGTLAGPDRHLRLDQLLIVGRKRTVGGAEALHPPALLEVDDDERIAAPPPQGEVKADRVAARPRQPVVAEERPRVSQLDRQDDRRVRAPVHLIDPLHPVAGLDPHPERLRPVAHESDDRAPAADRIARRGWRREQAAHERFPEKRRRQLSRVVVVGEHTAAPRQDLGRLGADEVGRPGAERKLDRGGTAAQPERGDGGADRRNPPDLVLPAEADAG